MNRINVTKPFLPPQKTYQKYINTIFASNILTNNGPLVQKFEKVIRKYLLNPYFYYVSNGTIALQLAIKTLNLPFGEIITTPFSYVATTNAIIWENFTPKFIDIEPNNFTLDPSKLESAISEKTRAIMPVHVFGYACQIEEIEKIGQKYNLPIIYDAAHAFGSLYNETPLVSFGNISTCSFHATKLFHTIEGGACITNTPELAEKIMLKRSFGHIKDTYYNVGINAKESEFHAAMGLANFKYLPRIIQKRKQLSEIYDNELAVINHLLQRPKLQNKSSYNYSYYPVIFESEAKLLKVFYALKKENIYPRRYFYPSLNTLPFLSKYDACPIAEDISLRIACLPLYYDLSSKDILRITAIIKKTLTQSL